jgi:micrococcal nuclease
MTPSYTYNAKITNVVDGDTVDALVDMGFHFYASLRFRVRGYDAPESYRPKTIEEKAKGTSAKERATELLLGKDVVIKSYKEGAYNRWEADIEIAGVDFATKMISEGHVK